MKQRYGGLSGADESSDITAFSNHSATTITEWLDNKEDDVWK